MPLSYGVAIAYVLVDTVDKGLKAFREAEAELNVPTLNPAVDAPRCGVWTTSLDPFSGEPFSTVYSDCTIPTKSRSVGWQWHSHGENNKDLTCCNTWGQRHLSATHGEKCILAQID